MSLFIKNQNKITKLQCATNSLMLTVFLVAIFWYALISVGVQFDFSFVSQMKVRLWDGFLMTLLISVGSLALSLLIGVVSAVMHSSKVIFVHYLSKVYVTFIRGTPLIMQIYLFYYIVGTAFGVENRIVSGIIILSVFEGAYISEIIRGGILALDPTQIEACKAVGFTKKQMIIKVIFPQLIATTLPALTGQFASIIKDSSLLSIIAIIELTQTIKEITALNLKLFEGYIFLGVLYLCLTLPITFISKWLEGKFKYENRN